MTGIFLYGCPSTVFLLSLFRHFCGSKYTSRSRWIHAMVPISRTHLGKGFAAFWRGSRRWRVPETMYRSNASACDRCNMPPQTTRMSSVGTSYGAGQQFVVKIYWSWWRRTFLLFWWINSWSGSFQDTSYSYGHTRHSAKITASSWHRALLQ